MAQKDREAWAPCPPPYTPMGARVSVSSRGAPCSHRAGTKPGSHQQGKDEKPGGTRRGRSSDTERKGRALSWALNLHAGGLGPKN